MAYFLPEEDRVAYDILDWYNYNDLSQLPPKNQHWVYCENVPRVGEKYVVSMDSQYFFSTAWVLFQPANAFLNGWENAQEIEQSAVVKCRLCEAVPDNYSGQGILAEILDVITLGELTERFQTEKFPGAHLKVAPESYGIWSLYIESKEGDVGIWQLTKKCPDGREHLVLECSWYPGQSTLFFGNYI